MHFATAVKICLFEKYADFQGRAGRAEYWWFMLFCGLIFAAFEAARVLPAGSWRVKSTLSVAHSAVILLLLLPAWGVHIRRLHDTGGNGAWFWALLASLFVGKMAFWALLPGLSGLGVGWADFLLNLKVSFLLALVRDATAQSLFFVRSLLHDLWYAGGAALQGSDTVYLFVAHLGLTLPAMTGLAVCLLRKGAANANRYGPPPRAAGVAAGLPEDRADIAAAVMDFPTAIKCCVLRKYADFKGRAGRAEYWYFALAQLIFLSFCRGMLDRLLSSSGLGRSVACPPQLLRLLIALLPLALPGLAVLLRRLHDADHSGWWVGGYALLQLLSGLVASHLATGGYMDMELLVFMLLVHAGYALVLLCMLMRRGTPGPNFYGPDPLAARQAATAKKSAVEL